MWFSPGNMIFRLACHSINSFISVRWYSPSSFSDAQVSCAKKESEKVVDIYNWDSYRLYEMYIIIDLIHILLCTRIIFGWSLNRTVCVAWPFVHSRDPFFLFFNGEPVSTIKLIHTTARCVRYVTKQLILIEHDQIFRTIHIRHRN